MLLIEFVTEYEYVNKFSFALYSTTALTVAVVRGMPAGNGIVCAPALPNRRKHAKPITCRCISLSSRPVTGFQTWELEMDRPFVNCLSASAIHYGC